MEVNYNGEWGTVCSSGWSHYSSYVVCRQLGLGYYGYRRNFGQGSGSIWLDNVVCTGAELTLASCGHFGFNVTRSYCGHYYDVGVVCYSTRGMYKSN